MPSCYSALQNQNTLRQVAKEDKTTTSNTSMVAAVGKYTYAPATPDLHQPSSTRLSLLLRRANMCIMHLCRKLETRNGLLEMRL
jgi:hypothetical protein